MAGYIEIHIQLIKHNAQKCSLFNLGGLNISKNEVLTGLNLKLRNIDI